MSIKWGGSKTWAPVPDWASNLPTIAETYNQVMLPIYCSNCHRKSPTRYITPNFGPFCADCLDDLLSELLQQEGEK